MESVENILEVVENSVRKHLGIFGVDFSSRETLGVAVSGGADSIALLTALSRVLPQNIGLKAVTVNHNIRPASETEGDAEFVQNYCKSIGIDCVRIDIPRGQVDQISKDFDCGIEDSARRLRYKAFEDFKNRNQVSLICLAHNRNDQVETVLMRFLSGGDSFALGGIPPKRDFYVRPLIEISRKEIESYLSHLGVSYRTDSTNFDTAMLRNKIRHRIIPMLDSEFPGWQNSVYSLSSKLRDDSFVIESQVQDALKRIDFRQENDLSSFSVLSFSHLPMSVKRRIVYKAVSNAGPDSRIPYYYVDSVCRLTLESEKGWHLTSCGIRTEFDGTRIYVGKDIKQATETCFSVIIEEPGIFDAGDWRIKVFGDGNGIVFQISDDNNLESVISVPKLCFPFAVRSRQLDDEILTAAGSFRSVSRILEDWKCPAKDRDKALVVQELSSVEQRLVAVIGSVLGCRDWIVKL